MYSPIVLAITQAEKRRKPVVYFQVKIPGVILSGIKKAALSVVAAPDILLKSF